VRQRRRCGTQVQELRPELYFVVTATTRAMRRGEQEGVDYLFVGTEEFEQVAVPAAVLSSRSADRLSSATEEPPYGLREVGVGGTGGIGHPWGFQRASVDEQNTTLD